MKKLIFTIGLQDKDSKKNYSVKSLITYLSHKLDYATYTACQGSYKYEDGSVAFKPSLKVEIILFDDDYKKQVEICKVIEDICRLHCNQESYLYEMQTSNSYNATLVYVCHC